MYQYNNKETLNKWQEYLERKLESYCIKINRRTEDVRDILQKVEQF
jgi:hypothetical protein